MRITGRLEGRTVHRLLNTLMMIAGLWTLLACGLDSDDRVVRRYAVCMADTNTTLHRLNVSSASGTVALSAKAVEERLRDQLEKGEVTMGEIRAGLCPLLCIGAGVGVRMRVGRGVSEHRRRLG